MIRKIYLFIILLSPFYCLGQDKYFSQFDLNMMYMNPAFAGFEANNKVLLHRRSQWMGYPKHFNSSILEANLSANVSKRRIGNKNTKRWTGGVYLITDTKNPVFESYEFGLIPWTMHFQFKKQWWLSLGTAFGFHFNTLNWHGLTFSDQINDYNTNVDPNTSASQVVDNRRDILFDPSFGFVVTKHLQSNNKKNRRWVFGMAFHHLSPEIVSWYSNESEEGSRLDFKYTVHAERIANFRGGGQWKIISRHQRQGSNVVQRNDLGTTVIWGNGDLTTSFNRFETGIFGRMARYNANNTAKPILLQSLVPVMRYSFKLRKSSLIIETSYSYDFTTGWPKDESLSAMHTSYTHEFSLKFIFTKYKPTECPAISDGF